MFFSYYFIKQRNQIINIILLLEDVGLDNYLTIIKYIFTLIKYLLSEKKMTTTKNSYKNVFVNIVCWSGNVVRRFLLAIIITFMAFFPLVYFFPSRKFIIKKSKRCENVIHRLAK